MDGAGSARTAVISPQPISYEYERSHKTLAQSTTPSPTILTTFVSLQAPQTPLTPHADLPADCATTVQLQRQLLFTFDAAHNVFDQLEQESNDYFSKKVVVVLKDGREVNKCSIIFEHDFVSDLESEQKKIIQGLSTFQKSQIFQFIRMWFPKKRYDKKTHETVTIPARAPHPPFPFKLTHPFIQEEAVLAPILKKLLHQKKIWIRHFDDLASVRNSLRLFRRDMRALQEKYDALRTKAKEFSEKVLPFDDEVGSEEVDSPFSPLTDTDSDDERTRTSPSSSSSSSTSSSSSPKNENKEHLG